MAVCTVAKAKDADAVIAAFARRQHGVVARRQVLEAGVTARQLDWRVRRGRLRVVHRGVYVAGPVALPRAAEMAAVLACGPVAVVSHVSAARLWAQLGGQPARPPHVIVRAGDHRRPGIHVHRISTLTRGETTRLDDIPITTPARTLLDLAGMVTPRELEQAAAETLARGLAGAASIRATMSRHPGSPGIAVLRAVLGGGPPILTRSEAEEQFLDFVREAKLPEPRVNVQVEGLEVDFFWPELQLVVEVDGVAFHSAGRAIERDRRRDIRLAAAGLTVVRLTWTQITDERVATAAALAAAFARY